MEKQECSFYEMLRTGSRYSRNLNHNYLVLPVASVEDTDRFDVRMIMENRIRSLLPLELRRENGVTDYYYEVSSLQPIIRIYEIKKISGEDMVCILREILKAFSQVREYLLAEEELVLHQEFIFVNPETKELRFLYCPFRQRKDRNIFGELSEYFLDRIDHQDSEAVVLAYQFYKIVRNENFVLREIEELCERQAGKMECRQEEQESAIVAGDEKLSPDDGKDLPEDSSEKKRLQVVLGQRQFGAFLLLTVGSLIFLALNKGAVNSYSKMLGFGFLMFGIGGTVISYLMKEKPAKNAEAAIKQMQGVQNRKERTGKDAWTGLGHMQIGQNRKERQTMELEDDCPFERREGDSGNEVQETEPVYGKTEFCLIGSGEEERILVERRHGKEITHRIAPLPFTIGKIKEMSDLYLSDSSVSRLHARIFEEEGKLYVMDLGSTNGTYLNGIGINREEKLQLEAGDELRIGKMEFVYQ